MGVLGADMETAALFTVGRLRNIRTMSILNNVVSMVKIQQMRLVITPIKQRRQWKANAEKSLQHWKLSIKLEKNV